MDDSSIRSLAKRAIEKLFSLVKISGDDPIEIENAKRRLSAKKDELLSQVDDPDYLERRARFESDYIKKQREKERQREENRMARRLEWKNSYAYYWTLEPVPIWNDETETVIFEPILYDRSVVEKIRGLAFAWESGDKAQKLYSFMFDHLSELDLDWMGIINRETHLYFEFVDGIEFINKNDPINSI